MPPLTIRGSAGPCKSSRHPREAATDQLLHVERQVGKPDSRMLDSSVWSRCCVEAFPAATVQILKES